jgi:pilus assembly protein TadC
MNSLIPPLLFISPVLAYAFNLLHQEIRDPLGPFHDRYRFQVLRRRKSENLDNPSISKSGNSLISEFGSLSRRKISLIVGLSILYIALAPSFSALLLIPLAITLFLYYERKRVRELKKSQSRSIERELPAVTELFAILISSGESTSSALNTLSKITTGRITPLLRHGIQLLQQGESLTIVLDTIARQSNVPQLRRFCDSLIIAAERGSSLGDVLSRQVDEIRSKEHSRKLESAGRAEIALMIPVVFLILPISVLFALWPSFIVLGQSATF